MILPPVTPFSSLLLLFLHTLKKNNVDSLIDRYVKIFTYLFKLSRVPGEDTDLIIYIIVVIIIFIDILIVVCK